MSTITFYRKRLGAHFAVCGAVVATLAAASIAPAAIPVPQPSGVRIEISRYVEIPNAQRINALTYTGDDLYVVDQGNNGLIHRVDRNNGGAATVDLFFNVAGALAQNGRNLNTANFAHGGVRAVAFHPDFPTNGKLYTSYLDDSRDPNDASLNFLGATDEQTSADSVLAEWTVDHQTGMVQANSYRELFRVAMAVYDHPIKQIGFNPNATPGDEDHGLLYVAHGDGGTQSGGTGQQGDDAHGKILRIDPLAAGSASYSIPRGNPFTQDPARLDEIYAEGFRNPHNFSWSRDAQGKPRLIVADIGQNYSEEVNLVDNGGNYGWRNREGDHVNTGGGVGDPLPGDDAQYGYTYPAAQFGHPGGFGVAIGGGFVLNDVDDPALQGQYVFGDFGNSGRLYHANFDQMLSAVTQGDPGNLTQATTHELGVLFDHDDDPNTPLLETTWRDVIGTRPDTRIGTGPDGEIYLTTKRNGWVYRIENASTLSTVSPPCDFDLDGDCTLADIDALTLVGIDENELHQWLADAAAFNGYSSPYLSTDFDLDRDVDITDFNTLASNFDPGGVNANRFSFGDSDADGDVDITDFTRLAGLFSPGGYDALPVSGTTIGHVTYVPEPASMVLMGIGGLLVLRRR